MQSTKFAGALKQKLIDQSYLCHYTKKPLLIGCSASLDHLFPISRYPELANHLDNVVWCLKGVNQMKRDMTEKEFLDICKIIVVNAPETQNAYGDGVRLGAIHAPVDELGITRLDTLRSKDTEILSSSSPLNPDSLRHLTQRWFFP